MTRLRRLVSTVALFGAAMIAAGVPADRASASGGGEGTPQFVEMAMLDVPIIEGDRTTGRLRMKLTLDAADAKGAATIEAALPTLREAALAAAGEFARLRASPYVAVDAGRLSSEMTAAVARPDNGVARVLLIQVSTDRL